MNNLNSSRTRTADAECARPRAQQQPPANQGRNYPLHSSNLRLLRSWTCALLFLAAALLLASAASASAATHYVDLNSTNATPPYSNWATAATNIQDAVDVAVAGDEIVVTNGVYNTGGRDLIRVEVDKPLNLRSVNGPQFTSIPAVMVRGGGGSCVSLTSGASVYGFALSGGRAYLPGGGAYGSDRSCTLSNCWLYDNSTMAAGTLYDSDAYGGGVYNCTLINCTLWGNSASVNDNCTCQLYAYASGGGAAYCTLINCTLTGNSATASASLDASFFGAEVQGGGAYYCDLYNCTLTGNSVSVLTFFSVFSGYVRGGGADQCTLNNCTLTANSAHEGGGASRSTLNNCTLTGNSAITYYLYSAGGADNCALKNCILYFNSNNNPLAPADYDYSSALSFCCTATQSTGGVGNITNAPSFVDYANGDLHLQSNSPCINAGNNSYLTNSYFTNCFDLDGNPRIVGGTVDLGAYEFQSPVSQISYAWLQQYGLPINSSTDFADPDGDAVDNYHEWLAGTNPTNSLSSPAQLTLLASETNVVVSWSTNAVGFTLQSTTNLLSPSAWVTNFSAPAVIGGQNVIINPLTGRQQFYRLIH